MNICSARNCNYSKLLTKLTNSHIFCTLQRVLYVLHIYVQIPNNTHDVCLAFCYQSSACSALIDLIECSVLGILLLLLTNRSDISSWVVRNSTHRGCWWVRNHLRWSGFLMHVSTTLCKQLILPLFNYQETFCTI